MIKFGVMDNNLKTLRAQFLNYDAGNYFITICTAGRCHYFGEIVEGKMILTELGRFVDTQLREASRKSNVEVPLWVVMPDHIHAIVGLLKNVDAPTMPTAQRAVAPPLRTCETEGRYVPSLSRYVNSLKGAVTKYARKNGITFAWQSSYYDHWIRSRRDGNAIAEYILGNVARWSASQSDKE